MIDWHSHVLPAVDDGSRDVNESLVLLTMLSRQKVDTVIATPHFFADKESVDDFLIRRDTEYATLKAKMTEDMPRILCGAEIQYYSGISKLENLNKLCIGGTKLLLIEMPVSKWTEYTVRELVELSGTGKYTVILAHVERYFGLQKSNVLYRLYESGILMQVNAGYFLGFFTKRKAISMLADGEVHLIGSDCHSKTERPPRIGEAFAAIEKKLGKEFVLRFNEIENSLLHKNSNIILKGNFLK